MTLEETMKNALDALAAKRLAAAQREGRVLRALLGLKHDERLCRCGCGQAFKPIRDNHVAATDSCGRKLDDLSRRTGKPRGRPSLSRKSVNLNPSLT